MRTGSLVLSLVVLFAWRTALAAPGTTAKEAFSVARERALAWQGDAAPRSIGADVDKSGRVSTPVGWDLTFWSKKANRDLVVYVGANKQILKTEEPKLHGLLKPFTDDFIDSDKALAEALAHGLPDGLVLNATLAANCPAGSKESLCWEILSMGRNGQVILVVSAKSGKYLGKK